ncbi:unnamed protein product [Urochloa decumbens]|uniref:Rieske domain-containing protein n=1 Tax=Urochloa decumbens TaxID=240449 RepID=A0ABC8YKP5_9POAL
MMPQHSVSPLPRHGIPLPPPPPLPRPGRHSLPFAAGAPLSSRTPTNATATVRAQGRRRRRRGARLSASETTPRAEAAPSPAEQEQFDWLDHWYAFAPVCDLDPGAPHGKTVLGLAVVAWYDRGAGEWRVFDDACPHRLAPLSEGRIDGKGRLQCVYHGWCFDGAGACQFIPQAPALGPPVHKNSRACVVSYPYVVQNNILWFYPRAEPEYRDVLQRKRPPYVPEIDDPGFVTVYGIRDLPYGGNLTSVRLRHIAMSLFCSISELSDSGFLSVEFFLQERKFAAAGLDNWQKACYVPTSSDDMVIAFRNWFRKFCNNRVGWATPQVDQLPPTPTKDQLMERYWSHVVQCTSCSAALKAMKALEVALQIASVAVIGFLAIAKGTLAISTVQRVVIVSTAVLCFAASRWLANFIQKNFYFQDYIHAYK